MHSTSNLEDGYFGSGKRLKYSIQKYGLENHTKEILEFLENKESLINREIQLITIDLLNDPMCMNLKPGGRGGFCNEEHKKTYVKAGSVAGIKKLRELKNDTTWHTKRIEEYKSRWKNEKYATACLQKFNFSGKSHSLQTKKLIGSKSAQHQTGSGNSQYGTCWITNTIENKKIKRNDSIPDGWKFGRTSKKK